MREIPNRKYILVLFLILTYIGLQLTLFHKIEWSSIEEIQQLYNTKQKKHFIQASNKTQTESLVDEDLLQGDVNIKGNLEESTKVIATSIPKATFPTFRDFSMDGPRSRFEAGMSQQELLGDKHLSTLQHDNNMVPFFRVNKPYYAAAWLSSIQTFMKNPNFMMEILKERHIKRYNPNLEMGTYNGVAFNGQNNYRTADMLDFFVHHLSRYMKSYNNARMTSNWQLYLERLDEIQKTYEKQSFNNPKQVKNGKVLVIAPFHAKGGHSRQDERVLHLNITIKSLANVFPNIVVTVCDQSNYDYIVHESGLNEYLYDVLLVKNLTMGEVQNCIHLPALSSVQAREKIREGSWIGFEWVYYTEPDQPVHLRNVHELLKQTLLQERNLVVPHRGHPLALPEDLNMPKLGLQAQKFINITGTKVLHDVPDILVSGCCFDNASLQTKFPIDTAEVELFRQHNSHAQIAGTCNAMRLNCNICKWIDKTKDDGPCKAFTLS